MAGSDCERQNLDLLLGMAVRLLKLKLMLNACLSYSILYCCFKYVDFYIC
jgi:hypothetical protein